MKKILLATAVAALCLTSCTKDKFQVSGQISQAADSTLYFENMALDGPQVVDSVKLDAEGQFSFSGVTPGAPEFYRLRIAGEIINLSVDSTEHITVRAQYPAMASQYEVEGSDDCLKIKELALKQMDLQARAQRILQAPDLNAQAVQDSIERVMAAYKEDVCRNYIYREPMRSYSYFALFQGIVVGNSYLMVFNPRRYADDVKAFAAVATCWDQFHPGSTRGENLHNIAIEGQKTQRIVQAQDTEWELDPEKVTVANLIDIDLPDNKGQVRRLTDLQGKVVLLDFHVFAAEGSAARILALRELYNKYHDRGLEIYQVSLDDDAHFWKTQTAALPWICVRDDQGASQSYLLQVQRLPADYIISRDNSVVMGPAQIKDLDADIARYL